MFSDLESLYLPTIFIQEFIIPQGGFNTLFTDEEPNIYDTEGFLQHCSLSIELLISLDLLNSEQFKWYQPYFCAALIEAEKILNNDKVALQKLHELQKKISCKEDKSIYKANETIERN